ncbi:adenosylcobinamide-GDP ribazoletransferase [Roseateles sp. BYS180W]|uniref:Adenosylcobinamide-GDP ribazoletransferase n=1 Tax=Roseateles rivi TaxID=3299028 RepID=A0ABW7FX78_9BURK
MHQLRLFFIALQFFTRLPIPGWVGFKPEWLQGCAGYFPLVGALLGLISGALLLGALQLFPPSVAVGLAMVLGLWLTGGFHEDGLADSFDGLGGGHTRERVLAIMKDSRIGSYGALALIMVLGLKAACLVALAEIDPVLAAAALAWGQCASRAAPVWLMHTLPYAGDAEHAKAKPLATQISPPGLALALGWVLLASLGWALAMPDDVPLITGALLALAAMTLYLQSKLERRLGGYTGDTLGASQQLGELAALLALLALTRWF